MRDVTVGTDLDIVVRGDLPPSARGHARQMIGRLARYTDLPMPHARVKLTTTQARQVIAEASVELAGRVIRAQILAASAGEGLDLLADVLRHRISRLQQHWEARLGLGLATPPWQWRHAAERSRGPRYVDRPVEERRIVRHKHVELAKCNLSEAIEDLELAGYRFHLFADVDTGLDRVVYRRHRDSYGVMTVSQCVTLDEIEALAAMNRSGRLFLFYVDRATGLSRVMYRRFDGHYAVICARPPHR